MNKEFMEKFEIIYKGKDEKPNSVPISILIEDFKNIETLVNSRNKLFSNSVVNIFVEVERSSAKIKFYIESEMKITDIEGFSIDDEIKENSMKTLVKSFEKLQKKYKNKAKIIYNDVKNSDGTISIFDESSDDSKVEIWRGKKYVYDAFLKSNPETQIKIATEKRDNIKEITYQNYDLKIDDKLILSEEKITNQENSEFEAMVNSSSVEIEFSSKYIKFFNSDQPLIVDSIDKVNNKSEEITILVPDENGKEHKLKIDIAKYGFGEERTINYDRESRDIWIDCQVEFDRKNKHKPYLINIEKIDRITFNRKVTSQNSIDNFGDFD